MKPRIAIPVPTSADLEYNRRCLPLYLQAIERSGGTPVVLSPTALRTDLKVAAASCSGVLLPGSPSDVSPARFGQSIDPATAPADPAREEVDLLLLEHAQHCRKPVLGICFGLQILNVWRGGTLLQDLTILPVNHASGPAVAVAHTATIAPSTLLEGLLERTETTCHSEEESRTCGLPVNSSHHQAIGIPGDGLRVSARCAQDGVIEAIEADPGHPASAAGQFVLAVQWHPERSYDTSPTSRALFHQLVASAELRGRSGGR